MKNLKIFYKIFLSHTVIGLITVLALSLIFYVILRDSLLQRTIDQLSSINILKRNQIEMHFERTKKNLAFLIDREEYETVFKALSSEEPERAEGFQSFVNDLEEVSELYHYKGLMVLTIKSEIVFSLNNREYANRDLVVKQLKKITERGAKEFMVMDLSEPGIGGVNLSYIHPLYGSDSLLSGFLVVQEDFTKIQDILDERTGMGSTGETYLVGQDFYMRSSSRFFPDSSPLTIMAKSKAAINGLKGIIEGHELKDYRGVEVLSYYRPLEYLGLHWAIISEMDVAEAMKPINELKKYFILVSLSIMTIVVLLTSFISNAISKPILYLKARIKELSLGVIPKKEVQRKSLDELGEIAAATRQLIEGFKRTAVFAHEIGSGNFNASYTTLSEQDVLGLALINMRDQLKMLTEREVKLVRERAAALMEGQEKERQRIIRELHDGVGQLLTVINLRLEAWDTDSEVKIDLRNLLKETIAEVRRISYNVMPSALVDFGLEAALKGLLENIKKYSGLKYEFTYVRETNEELSFEVRTTIFRVVQEGLNNIVKHSGATNAELYVLKNQEEVFLMLKDNGRGFNISDKENNGGFGLRSMRERAKLLNGEIEIHSEEGKGTIIEVHIPAQYHHE